MLKIMKLKTIFLCASLASSCSSQIHPNSPRIFGLCLLDPQRNELVHSDLIHSFRHPLPPGLDNRFPIRCTPRSVFFISSDGFLNGVHATSNLNSPFSLFMTQSDLRSVFLNLSDYSISPNGSIILQFTDGSIRRISLNLD